MSSSFRLTLPTASSTVGPKHGTPLLQLGVWFMFSIFFCVGVAQGDRIFLYAMMKFSSFKFTHDVLHYESPFCWTLSANWIAPVMVPYLGYTVGALLAVIISARWSRRTALWFGMVLYSAARMLQLTMRGMLQYFVGESIASVSCGALTQVTAIDIIELAPHNQRNALFNTLWAGQNLGNLCGAMLVFGLGSVNVHWAWRVVPAYALWMSLLLLVLLFWMPQAPASLVQCGKLVQARYALQEIRGLLADVDMEFDQILKAAEGVQLGSQFGSLRSHMECRLALVFALILITLTVAMGEVALVFNMKYVFMELFFTRTSVKSGGYYKAGLLPAGLNTDVVCVMMQGLGLVMGSLLVVACGERFSRRHTVAGFGALSCCSNVAMAALLAARGRAEQLPWSLAWLAAALASLAVACFSALRGIAYTYIMETQPLLTRSLNVGLLIAMHSLQTFIWTTVSLKWLCVMQGWGVYLACAGFTALFMVVSWLLMMETCNCPLEVASGLWKDHWFWGRFFPDTMLNRPYRPGRRGSVLIVRAPSDPIGISRTTYTRFMMHSCQPSSCKQTLSWAPD